MAIFSINIFFLYIQKCFPSLQLDDQYVDDGDENALDRQEEEEENEDEMEEEEEEEDEEDEEDENLDEKLNAHLNNNDDQHEAAHWLDKENADQQDRAQDNNYLERQEEDFDGPQRDV